MSLNEKQALKILTGQRDAHKVNRPCTETFWTLAIMYDSGKQWGYATTKHGRQHIRRLQNIVDPARSDVRVTMNTIHKDVRRITATLKPKRLKASSSAIGGSPLSHVIAATCDQLLDEWGNQIGALTLLRDKTLPQCVLGSAIIRRTITTIGKSRDLFIDGRDKKLPPLNVRTFRYGWSLCYPWEILRDASANSIRFDRDEEFIAHFKPRTTAWIKRTFGVDIETETTMGDLNRFQHQIFRAGGNGGAHTGNSQDKGVLVYEAYFKDPSKIVHPDERKNWAHVLFAWEDPKAAESEIKPIRFGPNPYYGQPFHMFTYDTQVQGPWARGIPHLQMQGQDLVNIAWTWSLRMMQQGSGKLMFEDGTVEKANRQFNNRLDQPITWKRLTNNTSAPTRLQPPQPNPLGMDVLSRTPGWMDEALNLTDVQRGVTSKRGESGEAVKLKLSEANVPLEDQRADDDMVLQDLLFSTLVDLTNPKLVRPDQLRELLGPGVPDEHLNMLLRNPIQEAIKTVNIHPTTLRWKTPAEHRDEITTLSERQIIPPEQAQWEMDKRGVSVNTLLSQARRKQTTELQLMIEGGEAPVSIGDAHVFHIRTTDEFINSEHWFLLEQDVKDSILEHRINHKKASILEQQMDALGQQAIAPGAGPEGSPPAATVEQPNLGPGAAEPAINVA